MGWPEQEATEKIEEDLELVEFAEADRPLEPDGPPASIRFTAADETEGVEEKREIKEAAEKGLHDTATAVADPEEIFALQEKIDLQELRKRIEPEPNAFQDRVLEKVAPGTPPEKTEQEEQVENIIELMELVEDEEIIELTELVEPEEIIELTDLVRDGELIEVEDGAEATVNTSNEDTILPVSENVTENSETDVCKKPSRKFGGTLFVTILLIGLITVTLYPSGLFKNGMVRKEKLEVSIAATHPPPKEKADTSKVPPSEKSLASAPGSKSVVVEKESTELPDAIAKPKPSPAKPRMTQPHKVVPSTTPNFEIVDAKEINPEAPPSGELRKFDTLVAIKQQASKMVSPESTGIEVHNVEKGDTLWNISKRYTGSGFNYQQVAKENKISNPDLIFPEQKLRVSKQYQ